MAGRHRKGGPASDEVELAAGTTTAAPQQEPDPGAPPDPAREDEEHHRLTDGTMLHVSIWTHADGVDLPARFISLPQVEGWTQLRAGPPGGVASR